MADPRVPPEAAPPPPEPAPPSDSHENDADSSPLELAQAIDAALDAASAALASGDTDTATEQLVAAGETSDSLLDALGAPEAPDTDVAPPPPPA